MKILVVSDLVFPQLTPFLQKLSEKHEVTYYGQQAHQVIQDDRLKNVTGTTGRLNDNAHLLDVFARMQPDLVFGCVLTDPHTFTIDDSYPVLWSDVTGTAAIAELCWVSSCKLCLFDPMLDLGGDPGIIDILVANRVSKEGFLKVLGNRRALQWEIRPFPREQEILEKLLFDYNLND